MEEVLQRFGYEIMERTTDDRGFFKEIRAKKIGDEIYFILERLDEQFVNNYMCRAKMIGRSTISTKFAIEQKNAPYGTAIRNSGILDDYAITAANEMEISDFLEHDLIFPLFEDLIGNAIDNRVEVNATNGNFLIRLKTQCDFQLALRSIPTMESLTWIFQSSDTLELLISGVGKYSCNNCNEEVTLEDTSCPNCGRPTPRCTICIRDPIEGEIIVQMNCCSTYVHQQELRSWLEIKQTCPYCKTENPSVMSVS
ncbi:MAG: RING finger domain-containing protein [Candidatus Kariarchaeaceae archaeon]